MSQTEGQEIFAFKEVRMPYYIVKENNKTIGYLSPSVSRKARSLNRLQGIAATVIDPATISEEHINKYFDGKTPWGGRR
jgi:hypothetical protein